MATILSVPALSSVAECANFDLTVKPYIPQLLDLPNSFISIASSDSKLADLGALYLNTNPLIFALAFALALSPIALIAAEINKNYSQIDRLWSILPAVYVAHYTYWAHANGLPTARLDNATVFTVTWSIRLTFNYWRRGGYNIGSEDYRWLIIKDYIGPVAMFIFDCTFISWWQSLTLFMVTSPTYILLLVSRVGPENMQTYDVAFSRGLLALIVLEFFADQQQWNYQEAKRKYRETAKIPSGCPYTQEDLDRGFNISGLWSWSRHPNFLAEQLIWSGLYVWAAVASEASLNWTATGTLAYLAIFQGSTWLTELITAGKYPEYAEYQRLVGRFFPKIFAGTVKEPRVVEKEAAKLQKIAKKKA